MWQACVRLKVVPFLAAAGGQLPALPPDNACGAEAVIQQICGPLQLLRPKLLLGATQDAHGSPLATEDAAARGLQCDRWSEGSGLDHGVLVSRAVSPSHTCDAGACDS
jgi:hypothetical protein